MQFRTIWSWLKLKQKILILFLPLTILSTLLVLSISISILIRNEKNESLKNSEDKLKLVTVQTEQILSNIIDNVKAFSTNSSLHEAIRNKYPLNAYGSYLFSSAMHSCIHNVMNLKNLISGGYIQTFDGKVFNVKTDEIYKPDDVMNIRYKEIISKKGKIMFGPSLSPNNENSISISKSLIDIETGFCLGVLVFDIRESLFHASYAPILDNMDDNFLLTDDSGIIISSDNKKELHSSAPEYIKNLINFSSQSRTIQPLSIDKLVMISHTNIGNYRVIYEMNYNQIYKEALHLALWLLFIGLFIIFISIILSSLLAQSIVHPITELAAYVDETGKGHFDYPIPIQSNDEIGLLARRFHNMNENIRELTIRIYNEQNQKKEFELRLLQAQINPHFLYNCLDNISSLITDKKNDTSISMIYHLGKYYRSVLSKGRNIITIHEEIDLIRNFLEIHLIKSPDLFTYHIEIDPLVLDFKILKMLLQPIVENSVVHGFSNYMTGGRLYVKGFSESDNIFIIISDNGKGIPENILNSLFLPTSPSFPKHFGLKNIKERLQLKFGDNFQFEVSSVEKKKTEVTIRFPKVL